MTDYYVDNVTGNNADTGLTEALAWETIAYALTQVAGGDTVYVKGGTDYTETCTISTAGSTGDNHIQFEGYTETVGDNGRAVINPSAAVDCVTNGAASSSHYRWKNITFTGGVNGYEDVNADSVCFINCIFSNNSGYGISVDNYCQFINCEFSGNGNYAVDSDLGTVFVACKTFSNGGSANDTFAQSGLFYKSVWYNGEGININNGAQARPGWVLDCTFDGDNTGKDAFYSAAAAFACVVYNNIIYDWVDGVDISGDSSTCTLGYNLTNNNTNDYNFARTRTEEGPGNVTSAPAFLDETNRNYGLTSTSPAVSAGVMPGAYS